MFSDKMSCLVQSPPFTLSYFTDSEALFLYKVSFDFIELSLFTTKLNIFFSERRLNLLTRTKVVKTAHCFDYSVAMQKETINTEAVNFLLCAGWREALVIAICPCSMKIGQDSFFRATGVVSSKC